VIFYVVRHGRAESTAPGGDANRRLTAEGRDAFLAHARALAPGLRVARVVTSPLERARETAALLARATGAPSAEDPALASGASTAGELLRLGARLGEGTALVGHNPELAEALALAAGRQVDVPPGTVAAIETDGGGFRLAWLRAPA
jgi:phosphohistidine phosphatase